MIAAILAISNFCTAQIEVDLKLGVHSSNVTNAPELLEVHPLVNLNSAINLSYALDDKFSLVSGVEFKRKGFQINETTNMELLGLSVPLGAKVSTEVKYIEVPLMLKYNLSIAKGITPYFSAGPSLAYATKGNLRTKATALIDINVSNTEMNLASSDYNRTQVVGNALVGVKLPYNDKGHWLLEAGYSSSFKSLVSENFMIGSDIKHKAWSFNIGYGLSF